MQSLQWYVNRLRRMTPSEVLWRFRSMGRDLIDAARIPMGLFPGPEKARCDRWKSRFRVSPLALDPLPQGLPGRAALVERAEALLRHEFTFFDFERKPFGERIDWHRDYNLGIRAPLGFSPAIDYRNAHEAGDCKLVWEHNRHQHLVVLARAYRVTGEERFSTEVVAQLESWMKENPFGYGMNWRSPMELGIRLINWVWALDLIADSPALDDDFLRRLRHSAYLHCWDTRRKYSQGSSANNHLIGEAAGVFIACAYWQGMPGGDRWLAEARAILEREIVLQSYDSGCSREHTFGYPYFVIQFFILAGLAARAIGDDFSPAYWARLEKMVEFMGRLQEGGRHVPMLGDADDGYVIDLDDGRRDYRHLLAVGAVLFERADFRAIAGDCAEGVWWLLGEEGRERFDALPHPAAPEPMRSHPFEDAGYFLLQSGAPGEGISILFDCAELGYGPIAAHGHADALSVVVRAFGEDLLVDPGTYDYYTYPEWRDYFRSTFAHNTVMVDGENQSQMQGRFLWGERAESRLIEWHDEGGITRVAGEHDGYRRLASPVTHRRTVELHGEEGLIVIIDEIEGEPGARHEASLQFHFSELCEVGESRTQGERTLIGIELKGNTVTLELDGRLEVSRFHGSERPIAGWISRGYHRKAPVTTVVGRFAFEGSARIETRLRIPPSGEG